MNLDVKGVGIGRHLLRCKCGVPLVVDGPVSAGASFLCRECTGKPRKNLPQSLTFRGWKQAGPDVPRRCERQQLSKKPKESVESADLREIRRQALSEGVKWEIEFLNIFAEKEILTPEQRHVWKYWFVKGKSTRETARLTGVSKSRVEPIAQTAFRTLRRLKPAKSGRVKTKLDALAKLWPEDDWKEEKTPLDPELLYELHGVSMPDHEA